MAVSGHRASVKTSNSGLSTIRPGEVRDLQISQMTPSSLFGRRLLASTNGASLKSERSEMPSTSFDCLSLGDWTTSARRRVARLLRIPCWSAVVLATVLGSTPASASFSVCNQGAQTAIVAFGRFDGTDWQSQGWWHIAPKSCTELLSGPLNGRYYYLYATDGSFETWDGSKNFCVGIFESFTIEGRGHCAARNLDQRGFFEIDTGNQLNWVQKLTPPH